MPKDIQKSFLSSAYYFVYARLHLASIALLTFGGAAFVLGQISLPILAALGVFSVYISEVLTGKDNEIAEKNSLLNSKDKTLNKKERESTQMSASENHSKWVEYKDQDNQMKGFIGKMNERTFKVKRMFTTLGDGNCGFRATLGGQFLLNKGAPKREIIIELLHNSLEVEDSRKKISFDLKQIYQDYVTSNSLPDGLPGNIAQQFKKFKLNQIKAATQELPVIDTQINSYVEQKDILEQFLNQYFIDEDKWPDARGILSAFATLAGIRIHCWKIDTSKTEDRKLAYYDIGEQPDESLQDVHLALDQQGIHFMRLDMEELEIESQSSFTKRVSSQNTAPKERTS